MLETKKKAATECGERVKKTLHVFLYGRLVSLRGAWDWDLYSDELFCSNVLHALQPQNTSMGSKCLVHPDDVKLLEQVLRSQEGGLNISFRVIAPNGSVKTISGEGPFEKEEVADFAYLLQQQELEQYIRIRGLQQENEQKELALSAYSYAEQITAKGIWYINASTYVGHYSDNVYRIFGLPPQSRNAHLHTFAEFVHPDERDVVSDTLAKAYREELPLHLEYRISSEGREKFIRQTTRWMYSDKGHRVIYGVIEDITAEKNLEAGLGHLKDELLLKDEAWELNEKMNSVASWYINLFTRQIVYSDAIYKIFRLKNTGIPLNNTILQNYVHPDDRAEYADALQQVYKAHVLPDMEFRIVRPDGKTRYLRQRGKMIINSCTEMIMLGIIQDVTDELMASKKLAHAKSSLELQRFIFSQTEELAGTGSWTWDLNTGEVKWSEGFYSLLGQKPETVHASQKLLLSYIHAEDRGRFTNAISALLHEGVHDPVRFRISKKGEIRYIDAHFILHTHDEQRLFVAVLEDVTDKHLLEQRLKDHAYLAEMLTDAAPERVLVVDTNNYILKWNHKCEEAFGIKKEKAVGKNIFELFVKLKTPEILSHFAIAQKGEPVSLKNQKSVLTGGYQNLLMSPVKDDNGNVLAVLVMMHDVTAEYKLREDLANRLDFIERLMEAGVDRIIALDRNMNYIYWNHKAEEYYGLKKEEALGKNMLELFPGFVTDPSYPEFRRALRGEIVHIEANQNLAARKGYFETYLIPVKNKKGEVTSILWIVHDLAKEYLAQRQQHRVAAVMDALNENLFELDDEYRFTYINTKAEEFFGTNKKEVIGKLIWDVLPQKKGTWMEEAIDQAMSEGISTRGEFISPARGTPVYASVAPTEEGVVVVFFEMGDLYKMERELMHRKELQEAIFNASHHGIILFKAVRNEAQQIVDFEVVLNNVVSREWNGRDLTGERYAQSFPQVKENGIFDAYKSLVDTGESLDMEVHYHGQGFNNWYHLTAVKLGDGLVATAEDITHRKQAELELTQTKELLAQMADASPDSITVYDLENKRPVYLNHCLANWLGLTSDELVAIGIEGRLQLVYPEDRPRLLHFNEKITMARDGEMLNLEYRLKNSDGKMLWIRNRSKAFKKNTEGKVTHILSILQDITEEKAGEAVLHKLNLELGKKNKELERKNEEITSFAFVASHDLKEPIRKLYTFADILATRETGLSDSGKKSLAKIQASVRRLDHLIEDILIISKVGAKNERKRRVDLNDVLENLKEDLDDTIEKTGAVIESDPLPAIEGDESHLYYLFRNIISNSLKFQASNNKPRIKVSVKIQPGAQENKDDFIRVSISDNGVGFPQEYAGRIFKMFQRLHSPDEFEGTGIGLAICKKIMEKHGGFISAESEEGKGTIIHCYFPLMDA